MPATTVSLSGRPRGLQFPLGFSIRCMHAQEPIDTNPVSVTRTVRIAMYCSRSRHEGGSSYHTQRMMYMSKLHVMQLKLRCASAPALGSASTVDLELAIGHLPQISPPAFLDAVYAIYHVCTKGDGGAKRRLPCQGKRDDADGPSRAEGNSTNDANHWYWLLQATPLNSAIRKRLVRHSTMARLERPRIKW